MDFSLPVPDGYEPLVKKMITTRRKNRRCTSGRLDTVSSFFACFSCYLPRQLISNTPLNLDARNLLVMPISMLRLF